MAKISERYFVYSSDCDIDQEEEERLLRLGSDEEDSDTSISEALENRLLGYEDDKLNQTNKVKGTTEHHEKSDEPGGTKSADVPVRTELAKDKIDKVRGATEQLGKSAEPDGTKSADVPVRTELAKDKINKVRVTTEQLGKSDEPYDGTKSADVPVRTELAKKVKGTTEHHEKSDKPVGTKSNDVRVRIVSTNDETNKAKCATEHHANSNEPDGIKSADVWVRIESANDETNKAKGATEHHANSNEPDGIKSADVWVRTGLANNKNGRDYLNAVTTIKVHDINNNQVLGLNVQDVHRESIVKIDKDKKKIVTGKAKRKAETNILQSSLEFIRSESFRMRKQKFHDVIPRSVKTDSSLNKTTDEDNFELDEVERKMVEQIADADDLLDEIDTFLKEECIKQKYGNHRDADADKTGTKSTRASDKDTAALIPKRFDAIDKFLDEMDYFFNVTCETPEYQFHTVYDKDDTGGVSIETDSVAIIPKRRINRLKRLEVTPFSNTNDHILEAPSGSGLSNKATDKSIEPTSIGNRCKNEKLSTVQKGDTNARETVELPVQSSTDEIKSRRTVSIVESSSDDDLSMKSANSTSSVISDTIETDCRVVKLSGAFKGDENESESVELDLSVFSSSDDTQSMKSASSTSTETFANTENEYKTIKCAAYSNDGNHCSMDSASWTSTETSEIDVGQQNQGYDYPEQQDDVLTVDDGYDMWQAYYSGTEYDFDATQQSENMRFYGVAESGNDDHPYSITHQHETAAFLNENAFAPNDVKPRFIFINRAKMPPMIDVNVDEDIESPEYEIEFA